MPKFAIIRKKERYGLTWLGRLLLLLLFALLILIFMLTIHPFLAVNRPVDTKIMVVEGFITDDALVKAKEIFEKDRYELMIVTGKKRIKGAYLDIYDNDGDYSAATLEKLGFDMNKLQVVVIGENVIRDRTWASALAVKDWLIRHHLTGRDLNLLTLGCHARRSRLLFKKAIGDHSGIGIISVKEKGYDPSVWWKTSYGFRVTIDETIAWIYARFFFYPDR